MANASVISISSMKPFGQQEREKQSSLTHENKNISYCLG